MSEEQHSDEMSQTVVRAHVSPHQDSGHVLLLATFASLCTSSAGGQAETSAELRTVQRCTRRPACLNQLRLLLYLFIFIHISTVCYRHTVKGSKRHAGQMKRKMRRKTHRVRDDEGFLTLCHFLLSNSLMQQTHTMLHTHTHTLSLCFTTSSPQLHQEIMQHSEQKNIIYERVCVCTCSHESCHVPALLLKRQFDWLMSKGKATCDEVFCCP